MQKPDVADLSETIAVLTGTMLTGNYRGDRTDRGV